MASAREMAACSCDANNEKPCRSLATQEDLLCDACRTARQPEFRGMHIHEIKFPTNSGLTMTGHSNMFFGPPQ